MPTFEGKVMMVEPGVCDEERFWTATLVAALKRCPVDTAFSASDAALELHRHMWIDKKEGIRLSLAAMQTGHEVQWNFDICESGARDSVRISSAKDVWSSAFSQSWGSGMSLAGSAAQADDALKRYATKIGVVVSSLLSECEAKARVRWRASWEIMDYGV